MPERKKNATDKTQATNASPSPRSRPSQETPESRRLAAATTRRTPAWQKGRPEVSEWQETTLGEFADFRNGKAISPEKYTATGRYPVIGSNGQIAHTTQNRAESRTLAGLRDALLPKLLSGELRVPQLPN